MKLQNYTFLANANRKRGKRGTALFLLLLFSVIALVLITSVTSMLHRVMDGFTAADPARRIMIDSFFPEPGKGVELTEEVLDDIRKLDHVQSVDINDGMVRQIFDINGLADENGVDCSKMMPPTNEYGYSVEAWSLYKTQEMEVVAGKRLDESPVFSCLVPKMCIRDRPSAQPFVLEYRLDWLRLCFQVIFDTFLPVAGDDTNVLDEMCIRDRSMEVTLVINTSAITEKSSSKKRAVPRFPLFLFAFAKKV